MHFKFSLPNGSCHSSRCSILTLVLVILVGSTSQKRAGLALPSSSLCLVVWAWSEPANLLMRKRPYCTSCWTMSLQICCFTSIWICLPVSKPNVFSVQHSKGFFCYFIFWQPLLWMFSEILNMLQRIPHCIRSKNLVLVQLLLLTLFSIWDFCLFGCAEVFSTGYSCFGLMYVFKIQIVKEEEREKKFSRRLNHSPPQSSSRYRDTR